MTSTFERVAVIVAMESELQHLPGLPAIPGQVDTPWPSTTWRQGPLEITAVLCGIGMIRAAAATEGTIVTHEPDAILNFGCTGSHRRDVNVGDVVIGTRSVAHTSMVIGPDGTSRFDLHDGREAPPPGETGTSSDPDLLWVAREAARDWKPAPWRKSTLEDAPTRIHEGVVASADVWTQSHAGIEALAERHHSMCEDMEAAAIAGICELHGIPFLTIKDISNNELLQATVFDSDMAHLPAEEVGRRAAILTGRVIDMIARQG